MFEQIAANRRKSAFLVVLIATLLMALGWFLGESWGAGGGWLGLGLAAVVWGVMTLVAWSQGDRIFLAMSGARKVGPDDLPVLYNVVEEMSLAAGLSRVPDVYVIDDPTPNAFATGRKPETASVAVTSGLLKLLNRDELQGVVAHEMGHVRNRDILLMLFAGVLAGAIVIVAEVGLRSFFFTGGRSRRSSSEGGGQAQAIIMLVAVVLMILAPIIAHLIYFAISRRREYLADASAAVFTRYPEGLASALEKIAAAPAEKLRGMTRATAPMYIVDPMAMAASGRKGARAATGATATHPTIAERVRILRAMGGRADFADYDSGYREITGKHRGVVPRSVLEDPHAGAGLRVQGERWREETASRPAGATTPAAATAAAAAYDHRRRRARQVDDFFYREQGYDRIACECGAVIKVPPQLDAATITCPRCGREHALSRSAS